MSHGKEWCNIWSSKGFKLGGPNVIPLISQYVLSHSFNQYVLSHVWLFATPWTVACWAPLSVGFSSKNIVMSCHVLLQGIFPTQGSNPGHPNSRQILNRLRHQGNPFTSMSSAKIWMILVAISTQTNSGHCCSCHTGHIYCCYRLVNPQMHGAQTLTRKIQLVLFQQERRSKPLYIHLDSTTFSYSFAPGLC